MRRQITFVTTMMIAALICGGIAYAVGSANAPSDKEARAIERAAYVSSVASSHKVAYREAKRSGRQKGLEQGIRTGRTKGTTDGRRDGERKREEEAAAQQAAVPEGIPGLAPGETLPPIPDGANEPNPAELCAQAPLSAEQLGYYCP